MSVNINKAFNRVENGFWEMNLQYGDQFSEISGFRGEWKSYQRRWDNHLLQSSTVANESIQILDRFNNVYLLMVQNIKNDQDRLNAIQELQKFIDENHDHSIEMSQGFLELKRDIEYFGTKFDKFLASKKIELENEATQLNKEIASLQDLNSLNDKIKDTETALAVSGALLNIIRLIVSGSILSSLQSEREGKLDELCRKQAQLTDVNRKQSELPHLKSDFDGLKPDIDLICDKLILFGEIWSSASRLLSPKFVSHKRRSRFGVRACSFASPSRAE